MLQQSYAAVLDVFPRGDMRCGAAGVALDNSLFEDRGGVHGLFDQKHATASCTVPRWRFFLATEFDIFSWMASVGRDFCFDCDLSTEVSRDAVSRFYLSVPLHMSSTSALLYHQYNRKEGF
jgi:hypothetical protein